MLDPHSNNNARGMLLIFLSTLCFSSGNGLMSALGTKVPPLQSAFYRYSVQCLISLATIWVSTHPNRLYHISTWCGSRQQRSKLFLRRCFGIMAVVSWFSALQILPLADATAINYFNIPLTSILAYIVLREPYSWADGATTLVCMAGIVLVVQPPFLFREGGDGIPAYAALVTLFGSCCAAMGMVIIRMIGPSIDPHISVAWYGAYGALFCPIAMLILKKEWVPLEWSMVMLEVAMCLLGWAGQVLLNSGYQIASAGPVSVVKYSDIIIALVVQWAVLGRPVGAVKAAGCLVVFSTVGTVLYKQVQVSAAAAAAKKRAEIAAREARRASDAARQHDAAVDAMLRSKMIMRSWSSAGHEWS